MELKDIVSVAGVGGLHQIVGQRPSGLILETLDEAKRRFPTSLTQKVSILEDIAMFTAEGEVRLSEVLVTISAKENEGLAIPAKNADNNALKAFMEAVLPTYDKERVYTSDIKKLVTWYGILKSHLDFDALKNSGNEEGENTDAKTDSKADTKPGAELKPKVVKNASPKMNNKNAPVKKTSTVRKTGGGS
jgi:hypothetical protein